MNIQLWTTSDVPLEAQQVKDLETIHLRLDK